MAAYRKYWKKSPPTHVLAAARVGYKPPTEETPFVTPEFMTLPEFED